MPDTDNKTPDREALAKAIEKIFFTLREGTPGKVDREYAVSQIQLMLDRDPRIAHLTAERDRLGAELREALAFIGKARELAKVYLDRIITHPCTLLDRDAADALVNFISDSPAHPPEAPAVVEEDGDEVFTSTPSRCHCGGTVKEHDGYYRCYRCGCSYGTVKPAADAQGVK